MESTPTVEQFMSNFFRERTTALKMVLEGRRDYRRRYYHGECLWDSRRGVVETSEAELIVSVSPSAIGTGVVTTGHGVYRSRYQVKSSGGSWLIYAVDNECGHCRVFGASSDCTQCGGTGWLSWKDQLELLKRQEQQSAAARIRPRPDEELERCLFGDSAIEQFMTDHFRERTATLKKEFEIYAEFANLFYSPECDWARSVVSVHGSEAERIVNIAMVGTGAQVITRDFITWRLRYNLRPAGQSWLIWEVDSECPVCSQQGARADCFWCGGKIWHRKKENGGLARGEQPGDEPPPDRPRWS